MDSDQTRSHARRWPMPFNQEENFREAIRRNKGRIAELKAKLSLAFGTPGARLRIAEENVSLEEKTAELEQASLSLPAGKRGRTAHGTREKRKLSGLDYASASRKVSDQTKYPTMTAREIAAHLGIGVNTVYEHPNLEAVSTGTRKRLWTTKSVIAVKNSRYQ